MGVPSSEKSFVPDEVTFSESSVAVNWATRRPCGRIGEMAMRASTVNHSGVPSGSALDRLGSS